MKKLEIKGELIHKYGACYLDDYLDGSFCIHIKNIGEYQWFSIHHDEEIKVNHKEYEELRIR